MSDDRASGLKPANYGDWWNTNTKDVAWYQEIHDAREPVHDAFLRWLREHDRPEDPIRSVLEIGCGCAVLYPTVFADRRYVGYDISRKEIEWCRANRNNARHEYVVGDFITDGIDERFDLVLAHAVIDHVYSVDEFLRAAVDATNRWVYLTAYRGWFPDLGKHRYSWSEHDTCFYNDLSPLRIHRALTALGCRPVLVAPSEAVIEPIGHEMVIVAERVGPPPEIREADPAWLGSVTVCPACLEGGILDSRREHPAGPHYRCPRCHRAYPADGQGVDFLVHDRLARLPAGALEMWALARHRAAVVTGLRDTPHAWGEVAREFAEFVSVEGLRVLDVGSPAAGRAASRQWAGARDVVALGPGPVGRSVPFTSVRAWAELIPFAAETFDAVVCARELEDVLCLDSALREFNRVLRPGGALYLWVSLFPDAAASGDLYPPLFSRPAGDVVPEAESLSRRQAALDEVARRTGDVGRLERQFAHLLADRSHVRHVPVRRLKTIASYGLQPEVIDVCGRTFHGDSLVLNLFVRLRKMEHGAQVDQAFVRQFDLLAGAAETASRLRAVSDRLEEVCDRVRALERPSGDLGDVKLADGGAVAALRDDIGGLAAAVGSLRVGVDDIATSRDEMRALLATVRADVLADVRSEIGALRTELASSGTVVERARRRFSNWRSRPGRR